MYQGLAEYYGNIDLDKRQVYRDPATNTIMTERSASVQFGPEDNPVEVLIPTVVNGKPVSTDEAVAHYRTTRENLGAFNRNDWLNANKGKSIQDFRQAVGEYANKIHLSQQERYK